MLVLTPIPVTAHTLRDSSIYVAPHARPTVLSSRRVVNTSLSGVSGYRGLMCEVQDACAECFWYHGLRGSVECWPSDQISWLSIKNSLFRLFHLEVLQFGSICNVSVQALVLFWWVLCQGAVLCLLKMGPPHCHIVLLRKRFARHFLGHLYRGQVSRHADAFGLPWSFVDVMRR